MSDSKSHFYAPTRGIAWLLKLLLVHCALAGFVGCMSWKSDPHVEHGRTQRVYSPSIHCSGGAYIGNFGDGERAWDGNITFDLPFNKITHVPTKTEFYVAATRF